MQHFARQAVDAFQEAVGFLMFSGRDTQAARTLKLKTTKTTTKTV